VNAKTPLGLVFIDLNKAYDRVNRRTLWEDMAEKLKIPQSLIQIIRNMYIGNKGTVYIDGEDTACFRANTGVKQGDEASPKLFCIFFD
jgi:hypothetical protein